MSCQTGEDSERSTARWLESMGVALPPYLGPHGRFPRTKIFIVDCNSVEDVVATIVSLLKSSCQDFEALLEDNVVGTDARIWQWLGGDARFSIIESKGLEGNGSQSTMILPSGVILTPYAMEALYQALALPLVRVVRVAVSNVPSGVEFWSTDFLYRTGPRKAESAARASGGERWINGEALGIHAIGDSPPRVFFRRGAADRHIVEVMLFDAKRELNMTAVNEELVALRREISRLKKLLTSKTRTLARPGSTDLWNRLSIYGIGRIQMRKYRSLKRK